MNSTHHAIIDALCTPSVDNGSTYARPRRNPSIKQRRFTKVIIMREAINNWACDSCKTKGQGLPKLLAHSKDTDHKVFTKVKGETDADKFEDSLQSYR